jgi:hypothetical protein
MGCCECGDETPGSCAMELVGLAFLNDFIYEHNKCRCYEYEELYLQTLICLYEMMLRFTLGCGIMD